jgi:hypothetical protein
MARLKSCPSRKYQRDKSLSTRAAAPPPGSPGAENSLCHTADIVSIQKSTPTISFACQPSIRSTVLITVAADSPNKLQFYHMPRYGICFRYGGVMLTSAVCRNSLEPRLGHKGYFTAIRVAAPGILTHFCVPRSNCRAAFPHRIAKCFSWLPALTNRAGQGKSMKIPAS